MGVGTGLQFGLVAHDAVSSIAKSTTDDDKHLPELNPRWGSGFLSDCKRDGVRLELDRAVERFGSFNDICLPNSTERGDYRQ